MKRIHVFQALMAIGLFGVSLGHIYRSVKSHEILWIVITSVEALCFLGASTIMFHLIIKNNKQAA